MRARFQLVCPNVSKALQLHHHPSSATAYGTTVCQALHKTRMLLRVTSEHYEADPLITYREPKEINCLGLVLQSASNWKKQRR